MRQREVILQGLPKRRRVPPFVLSAYGFTGRLVRDKPLGAFGGLVILIMLVVGLLADLIAPYEYDQSRLLQHPVPPRLE
jgi:peptide/nickel transport system permease protein